MSPEKGYQLIVYGNMTYRDSLPMFLQTAISAILKDVTKNPNASFIVKPQGLPLTNANKTGQKAGMGSIVAFLFSIAFALIPGSVISQIVHERESKVKHQQIISGATLIPYWLAAYTIDVIRSMISIAVAIIFVYVFNVDLPYVWILFILFGFAIHPFTYFTSHLFSKEGVAQSMTILFHIAIGGLLSIAVLVLQSLENTKNVGNGL